VDLKIETRYPGEEAVLIKVTPQARKKFTVKLRVPSWCSAARVKAGGRSVPTTPGTNGYVAITRTWEPGDKIELRLKLEPRVIVGDPGNAGKLAAMYGPLDLAAEDDLLAQAKNTNTTTSTPPKQRPAALSLTTL